MTRAFSAHRMLCLGYTQKQAQAELYVNGASGFEPFRLPTISPFDD